MHTTIYKIDKQHRGLNSILYNNIDGKRVWKRIHICMYIKLNPCAVHLKPPQHCKSILLKKKPLKPNPKGHLSELCVHQSVIKMREGRRGRGQAQHVALPHHSCACSWSWSPFVGSGRAIGGVLFNWCLSDISSSIPLYPTYTTILWAAGACRCDFKVWLLEAAITTRRWSSGGSWCNVQDNHSTRGRKWRMRRLRPTWDGEIPILLDW